MDIDGPTFDLCPKKRPVFINLGQGLSQKVVSFLISSKLYDLAFQTKCWLFRTRNTPLSLFMAFWPLYFHNSFAQILFKGSFFTKKAPYITLP